MASKFSNEIFQNTLITGADGMVGGYLNFGQRFGRKQLDVTNLEQVLATVKKHQPKIIVHLAAMTDLAGCEKDQSLAYMVNAVGTYNMALAAREINAKLIYISTSAVFDGLQTKAYGVNNVPNPQTSYSRSKYLGELAVRGLLEDYAIVRTCWIFGGGRKKDKKFVGKIMAKLEAGDSEIPAPMDHFGSPTYAKDLAAAICQVILEDRRGVMHVANQGSCSRAEEAGEIITIIKASARVAPVPAASFGLPDSRLREAVESYPVVLRPWQEALREYLTAEW